MTISKKLALITTFGLTSISPLISAYNEAKVMQILNCAEQLKNNVQNQDMIQWLHTIVRNETASFYSNDYVSYDLLTITHILDTYPTLEAQYKRLVNLKMQYDNLAKITEQKRLQNQEDNTRWVKHEQERKKRELQTIIQGVAIGSVALPIICGTTMFAVETGFQLARQLFVK